VDFVKFEIPEGPEWELLIAAVVVLIGPLIVERLRIPGLVGLLFGGMVVGPNVLGLTDPQGGIVSQLGAIGLLYLMFMAGLDLDLNVFAKVRNQAVTFALMTFFGPFALGFALGATIGYELGAAALLGSVFASHTLVTYPLIRSHGLATNRAVAITVGATVITDTLALIVLAVVSGQASGDASGVELISQVALGLLILSFTCFVILPWIGRIYFATIGRGRVVRYTFAVAVLLTGSAVASAVGIEPIVGAFFAGLAINRLVPNESEIMEHIEFFGAALLIPIFLVSVGTVIDPAKLVSPTTLGLALVFTVGAIGGKTLAVLAARPAFHLTWDELGVVFSLSVSQAAATLAATFVGLRLGLFDTSAVNAIMLVIVVSLVLSSFAASHFSPRVPRPPIEAEQVGRSVLVLVERAAERDVLPVIAARLAQADGGVIRPVFVMTPGSEPLTAQQTRDIEHEIAGLRVDAKIDVRHDRSLEDGVAHAAASFESSLVLMRSPGTIESLAGSPDDLVRRVEAPVALVTTAGEAPQRVVLPLDPTNVTRPRSAVQAAVAVTARLVRSGLPGVVVCEHELAPDLRNLLGGVTEVRASVASWLTDSVGPSDVVVVPGGRGGVATGARAERRAEQRGATVVIVTDREALDMRSDGSSIAAPLTAG
jgi:Kef-type K+ transport system membrane component KefB